MKKIKIIHGKPLTGKTKLAKLISKEFKNPLWVDGRCLPPVHYLEISRSNDLVVIDDLPVEKIRETAFSFFEDLITIDKRGMQPFEMKTPNLIISLTDECDFQDLPASFLRRVEFIKL